MKNLVRNHLFSLVTAVNTAVYFFLLFISLLVDAKWLVSVMMLAGLLMSAGFCLLSYRNEKKQWVKLTFITLFSIIALPAFYVVGGTSLGDELVFFLLMFLITTVLLTGYVRGITLVIQCLSCLGAIFLVQFMGDRVVENETALDQLFSSIRLLVAIFVTGAAGGILIRYRNILLLLLLEGIREGENWEQRALLSNQERDVFLINTSHEMNQSLNEILESTQTLLEVGTDVDRMEDFYYIHQSSESIKTAISELRVSVIAHRDNHCNDSDEEREQFYRGLLQKLKETMETSKDGYQVPEEFYCPEAVLMIVDDNEINLEIMKNMLEKYRCRMLGVTSGAECLSCLETEAVDLIFLDYMMPEMDGMETLHRIRQMPNTGSVPVVVLTADAQSGAKEHFIDGGFDDYMKKPVQLRVLEGMLRKYLHPDQIMEVEP